MVLKPPGGRIDVGRIDIGPIARITVQPVEDNVKAVMTENLKAQLGLADLPPEMTQAVAVAAAAAAQKTVELSVVKAAEEASRDVTKGDLLRRFDDKLQVAATGIGHLGQSSQVDAVLKSRAELLAKKKAALVAAGFTDTEAMEIILADIAARGH